MLRWLRKTPPSTVFSGIITVAIANFAMAAFLLVRGTIDDSVYFALTSTSFAMLVVFLTVLLGG